MSLGYTVQVASKKGFDPHSDCIIALGSHSPLMREQIRSCASKKILIIFEPPTVSPVDYNIQMHVLFDSIFSMIDTLIGEHYKKLYYPQPSLAIDVPTQWAIRKKFCTLIAGNKEIQSPFELYSKRLETIAFFETYAPHNFRFLWCWMEQCTAPMLSGNCCCKKRCLENYKFCICYENTRDLPGYVTEKIFDCLVAGYIPVYRGTNNITTYIPNDCFIDARLFDTDEQLYAYLCAFDEQAYQKKIPAITTFLASTHAFLFSCEFFVHSILKELDEHYCMTAVFSAEICQKLQEADTVHAHLEQQRTYLYREI